MPIDPRSQNPNLNSIKRSVVCMLPLVVAGNTGKAILLAWLTVCHRPSTFATILLQPCFTFKSDDIRTGGLSQVFASVVIGLIERSHKEIPRAVNVVRILRQGGTK